MRAPTPMSVQIKTAEDIAGMRVAGRLASELLDYLTPHVQPGITTGDIDNNVHPAGTLRMADALIKANKRFDFFIFPGQRHGYGNMSDYWFWLRAEYFVRHLLGDHRWNANITELDLERAPPGGRAVP